MIPSAHHLSLKLLQKCPSCESVLDSAMVHVLIESDTTMMAHIACSSCLASFITMLSNHPHGMVGNAILTDLNYPETMQSLTAESITEDEFLTLYRMIEAPNFIELLRTT